MNNMLNKRYLFGFISVVVIAVISAVASGAALASKMEGGINAVGVVGDQKLTGEIRITYPANGEHFTYSDIIVRGICPANSVVTLYDNGAIRGSGPCVTVGNTHTFAIPIRLLQGENILKARAVNERGTSDMTSQTVTVYLDSTGGGGPGGQPVCPTGQFYILPVEGSVNAIINAPSLRHVVIVGGTQPYTLSWDWGDGSASTSTATAEGQAQASHIYNKVGRYIVTLTITDKNGARVAAQMATVALRPSGLDLPGRLMTYWPLALLILALVGTYLLGHRRGRHYELDLIEEEYLLLEHERLEDKTQLARETQLARDKRRGRMRRRGHE